MISIVSFEVPLREMVKLTTLLNEALFITPRKRSLGQGYVFTPVCDSVHKGGVCPIACWDTPPGHTNIPWTHPPGHDTTGYTMERYTTIN